MTGLGFPLVQLTFGVSAIVLSGAGTVKNLHIQNKLSTIFVIVVAVYISLI